ncbi:DUF397 domain-containing protein [Nocardiopsis sp. CNR-923]|uniref:DUF397 domain-containing protein n=1 Tax=Nocardiopsis sp. CNR-923 TaxID=1904965 RepID=UPI0009608716|nr:DUF397 domain-containing protein [Nocardiopsis sp. CNR-923]OLT26075.1 DUF397 domain-containing protein [Nocardiopsis sp. CNR-923]
MNEWHKSSYSSTGPECVEVYEHEQGAYVRDTQYRELGHLPFDAREWAALLASVTR